MPYCTLRNRFELREQFHPFTQTHQQYAMQWLNLYIQSAKYSRCEVVRNWYFCYIKSNSESWLLYFIFFLCVYFDFNYTHSVLLGVDLNIMRYASWLICPRRDTCVCVNICIYKLLIRPIWHWVKAKNKCHAISLARAYTFRQKAAYTSCMRLHIQYVYPAM